MNVLIATDKFKGSLSAEEVGEAISRGLRNANPNLTIRFHPMADGGDGSLDILKSHLNLEALEVDTVDPLGRRMRAQYYKGKGIAFIEVASASGLVLLENHERNPLLTSTYGTGLMIRDAIVKGCHEIYLFLGGSATNDAGMGIAAALGCEFLDEDGTVLAPTGQNLTKVRSIKKSQLKEIQFTLLCDVTNPMFGYKGAAYVYAPQKGADDEMIKYLDGGLQNFNKVIQQQLNRDVNQLEGSGAAGAIGAGMVALFDANLKKGFDTIASLTNLEEAIEGADWVISGEGRLDEQSLQGKVIDGVAKLCRKYNKPLRLIVGKNELNPTALSVIGVDTVLAIMDEVPDLQSAMQKAVLYLETISYELGVLRS